MVHLLDGHHGGGAAAGLLQSVVHGGVGSARPRTELWQRHLGVDRIDGEQGLDGQHVCKPLQRAARQLRGSAGMNRGGCRTRVACSKANASLTSVASPKQRPMKVMLTGSPDVKPAGTLTSGYPARAAGEALPRPPGSPLTRSIGQAGLPVGATRASSLCSLSTLSMPSAPERRWVVSSASRYAGS